MKVIGVIPSRYASTRFPGKPLVDICGKPMLWWVYCQAKKSKRIDEIYAAIDDPRVEEVCMEYQIPYVMTSNDLPEHISRIHEVSEKISADFYVCINGDEPLVDPESIEKVIPLEPHEGVYFNGAVRALKDSAETIDSANLKVVLSNTGRCLYISRTPVPYPKGSLFFSYFKYVGIECFTKKALDFFVRTPQGNIEKIEDIDHLRFLENGYDLHFIQVESDSISVDTQKDLEKVRILKAASLDITL